MSKSARYFKGSPLKLIAQYERRIASAVSRAAAAKDAGMQGYFERRAAVLRNELAELKGDG